MAAEPVPIILTPTTALCSPFPASLLRTNDVFPYPVLGFGAISDDTEPSAAIEAVGKFKVPAGYASAADFLVEWETTKIVGNVVWDIDFRAVGGDDVESLDQTGNQQSLSVTDGAGSAAHEKMQASSFGATAGNFSPGDIVQVTLRRDGADASDTLAGCAMVNGFYFEWSD